VADYFAYQPNKIHRINGIFSFFGIGMSWSAGVLKEFGWMGGVRNGLTRIGTELIHMRQASERSVNHEIPRNYEKLHISIVLNRPYT
jgi:hypothetical protein